MATISIMNASRNSSTIATAVPVQDLLDNDADLNFVRTRYLNNAVVTLAAAPNQVDTVFWSNWSAANNAPSLSRVIYPA
jgi:hypothetical protein